LLLDEHTAALDPKTAATVMAMTEQLIRSNGLTALMITHNMADAESYGDRTLVLENGRIK
jgi:putative ABC transport system ATP-binding protein